jgi:hypothetical protein
MLIKVRVTQIWPFCALSYGWAEACWPGKVLTGCPSHPAARTAHGRHAAMPDQATLATLAQFGLIIGSKVMTLPLDTHAPSCPACRSPGSPA